MHRIIRTKAYEAKHGPHFDDEEMTKCEAILKQLDYTEKEPEKEDPRIQELQDQVRELKDLIKQASNMVPPQMKQMLPQNIQNAMNEAS